MIPSAPKSSPPKNEENAITISNAGMFERVKSGAGLALYKKDDDKEADIGTLYEIPTDTPSYYFYNTPTQDYAPTANYPNNATLFLEAITEEDSDDLRSISSASSYLSPQIRHANYSALIAKLPQEDPIPESDTNSAEPSKVSTPVSIKSGEDLLNHEKVITEANCTFSDENELLSIADINIISRSNSNLSLTSSSTHSSLNPSSITPVPELYQLPEAEFTINFIRSDVTPSPSAELLSEATESVAESVATFYHQDDFESEKGLISEELPFDPITITETDTIKLDSNISEIVEEDKKTPEPTDIMESKNSSKMEDHQDRDTSEVLVSDLFDTPQYPLEDELNYEDRDSPISTSIHLDHSHDSLLDQSICSNPRDETHIMARQASRHFEVDDDDEDQDVVVEQTISRRIMSTLKNEKSDQTVETLNDSLELLNEDLPPPPDQFKTETFTTSTTFTPSPLRPTILPPAPASMIPKIPEFNDEFDTSKQISKQTVESSDKQEISNKDDASDRNSAADRLPKFLYGYGTVGKYQPAAGNSPTTTKIVTSSWTSSAAKQVDPEKEETANTKSTDFPSNFSSLSSNKGSVYNYPESNQSYASTIRNIPVKKSTSNDNTHITTDFSNMETPQFDAHPPSSTSIPIRTTTIPVSKTFSTDPYSTYKSETPLDLYRDDIISEGRRSRSTVREVPVVIRGSSVYGGGSSHIPASSMTTEYRTTSTTPWTMVDGNPLQEEYYRREVTTRTLVTRSTETLSQLPYYGRDTSGGDYRISSISSNQDRLPPLTSALPETTRDDLTSEYMHTHSLSIQEEERRIKEIRERREREESDRRRREEENKRHWDIKEAERIDQIRRERDRREKEFETEAARREREENSKIQRDRDERERLEKIRREEWNKLEQERRDAEERDLNRRREQERLEKLKLEREKIEEEKRERERIERERLEFEAREKQRVEYERIERERIERERIEIERIERIRREKIEKDKLEQERLREEQERLQRERENALRIERERLELERKAKEAYEKEQREAEIRRRQRMEDEMRERKRKEEELADRLRLEATERALLEKEKQRKLREQEELKRLAELQREQEYLEKLRREAELKEKQRQEEERREKDFLREQELARKKREQERIEDELREQQRVQEERLERERRERERLGALERERIRQIEEAKERDRASALERSALERDAQRQSAYKYEEEIRQKARYAQELREREKFEADKRDAERLDEERRIRDLRDKDRRNQEIRDRERREAAQREEARKKDDWKSRERLDLIFKERDDLEKLEQDRRRVLAEREEIERRRKDLTSKETLERLTRKPYYSRENLSSLPISTTGEITTKIERQVIDRVTRTLITEDNINTYPLEHDGEKERIYHQNRLQEDEDFHRNGLDRASKIKAKSEKAKKDFFSAGLESSSNVPDYIDDRFKKSAEDINRRKIEYRGPLLQNFHDGEFKPQSELPPIAYPRMGPSPYDQMEETDLNDVHNSRRNNEYSNDSSRYSRGPIPDEIPAHSRSKSADYLLNKCGRDEITPPENELQKTSILDGTGLSEHELRFRKSTEKLTTPNCAYTVSEIPNDWEIIKNGNARVIEVVDTFASSKSPINSASNPNVNASKSHGNSVTIEEAMEGIYETVVPSGSVGLDEERAFDIDHFAMFFRSGPSIFCSDVPVWKQILDNPNQASRLVIGERLYVRCTNCAKTKEV
uniref:BRCT domain-containing protein n=1 Tax=Rhabditophanes sp. KR3021 TaxID=114890 RepID=A0AC35UHX1_9BILA